jgi:hypothetical protein
MLSVTLAPGRFSTPGARSFGFVYSISVTGGLRAEALGQRDALITVQADCLEPHLENFWVEIMRTIQVKASEEGLEMLIGAMGWTGRPRGTGVRPGRWRRLGYLGWADGSQV